MDASITAEAAALGATVLATVGAMPQLGLLRRTGDTAEVSTTCAMIGVGTELAWAAYAVRGELWSAAKACCGRCTDCATTIRR